MSIWASQSYIGLDHGHPSDPLAYTGPPPRTYQGSHVYPTEQDRPARVDTAAIPHWCIPGHEEGLGSACPTCGADVDGDAVGVAPWLRLSIGDPAADMTIVMPADAVRALRDELDQWLGRISEVPPL